LPKPKPTPSQVLERLMSKVVINPTTGCWEFTGSIEWTGYGKISVNQKYVKAHRLSYELHIGPIPPGMDLDHICHTIENCPGGVTCPHRRCVNPAHLKPATRRENARRGHLPGPIAKIAALNRAKTHCPHGHPYDAYNTYVYRQRTGRGDLGRQCKECNRIRARKYSHSR